MALFLGAYCIVMVRLSSLLLFLCRWNTRVVVTLLVYLPLLAVSDKCWQHFTTICCFNTFCLVLLDSWVLITLNYISNCASELYFGYALIGVGWYPSCCRRNWLQFILMSFGCLRHELTWIFGLIIYILKVKKCILCTLSPFQNKRLNFSTTLY